jgi:hypothetical protein
MPAWKRAGSANLIQVNMENDILLNLTWIVRIELLLLFVYFIGLRSRLNKSWRLRIAIVFTVGIAVSVVLLAYSTYIHRAVQN